MVTDLTIASDPRNPRLMETSEKPIVVVDIIVPHFFVV